MLAFWKKPKQETAPAEGGGATETKPAAVPAGVKLIGPKQLPETVGKELVVNFNKNPDWVWRLMAVQRTKADNKDVFEFRVYDDAETSSKKVLVKDWTSLDTHPELVLYEGWYNKTTKQIKIEEKRKS